jgi:hypothetical protein
LVRQAYYAAPLLSVSVSATEQATETSRYFRTVIGALIVAVKNPVAVRILVWDAICGIDKNKESKADLTPFFIRRFWPYDFRTIMRELPFTAFP